MDVCDRDQINVFIIQAIKEAIKRSRWPQSNLMQHSYDVKEVPKATKVKNDIHKETWGYSEKWVCP